MPLEAPVIRVRTAVSIVLSPRPELCVAATRILGEFRRPARDKRVMLKAIGEVAYRLSQANLLVFGSSKAF